MIVPFAHRQLAQGEGNMVVSPVSIAIALAMASAGSSEGSDTHNQMRSALKHPLVDVPTRYNVIKRAGLRFPVSCKMQSSPSPCVSASALHPCARTQVGDEIKVHEWFRRIVPELKGGDSKVEV